MIAPLKFVVVSEYKGINREEEHIVIEKELNDRETWSETYGMKVVCTTGKAMHAGQGFLL